MKSIRIGDNEAGQRLDKLLEKYLNLAGKGFIYKMIRKKNITLNGKKCTGAERLAAGDEVKLFLSDETIGKFSQVKVQKGKQTRLDVIYEDEHVLLINKPAGMLSQKAEAEDESLVEHVTGYLLETGALKPEDLRTFRPSVCNRLDRNTSGLIVAGKSLAGLRVMAKVFKDRSLHKFYYCVVRGGLRERQTIRGFLLKDEKTNQVTVYDRQVEGSLPIITSYEPVSQAGGYTLLKVELITGRTHQIRAHLACAGHPLVGDVKYGDEQVNREAKKRFGIRRQMLHSCRIEFPELEKPLEYLSGKSFQAPLPEEFGRVCPEWGKL